VPRYVIATVKPKLEGSELHALWTGIWEEEGPRERGEVVALTLEGREMGETWSPATKPSCCVWCALGGARTHWNYLRGRQRGEWE
jgi:hypothetical protein